MGLSRTRKLVAAGVVGTVVALGAGGVALASGDVDNGDDGDPTVTGAQADQATKAALGIIAGGHANSVERDSETGATWEVEVTKPNGDTVDVRLDERYHLVVVEDDSGS